MAKTAKQTKTAITEAVKSKAATESEIARRAYDLYVERGREHGHDVEDWLQAERELNGTTAAAAA